MRRALYCVAVAAVATTATAQPYYAKGDFNAWGLDDPMSLVGLGFYQVTVGGLNPGDMPEYKIADENWTNSWPGSNGKVAVDAAGEINFNLMLGGFGDGWSPAQDRVGYQDPGMHGWDIMGSFNGWSDPVTVLTDMTNGLYSGSTVVADVGTYEFKFRKEGDWAIAIGDDFGNSAANISVTTNNPGDIVMFELDLPNGRWRTTVTPTPATIALIPLAGLFARRRR